MNKIKKFRKEKGLSQLELSYKTEIHPSDISKLERKKVFAYKNWRKKLATALECKEESLFPNIDD